LTFVRHARSADGTTFTAHARGRASKRHGTDAGRYHIDRFDHASSLTRSVARFSLGLAFCRAVEAIQTDHHRGRQSKQHRMVQDTARSARTSIVLPGRSSWAAIANRSRQLSTCPLYPAASFSCTRGRSRADAAVCTLYPAASFSCTRGRSRADATAAAPDAPSRPAAAAAPLTPSPSPPSYRPCRPYRR